MTNDHADKSLYTAAPKRKPLALLIGWIIWRWYIRFMVRQVEADSDYWHDMERYAAIRQRVNMQIAADRRGELAECERVIGELSK